MEKIALEGAIYFLNDNHKRTCLFDNGF